ncbi:hypothetical protein [Streptomyces antimicrobicus]|uniref:BON domain-containing protein n=1 Tax=Streptomyces antimicrobicus TaxID=2883108 RepID=A0ABS8B5C0_9ACTN|nr:hypothetical protein [Streptomyces antimicrobicus]MCB5179778.1 hypothetical protein [Streptomyces antimicrobicus]
MNTAEIIEYRIGRLRDRLALEDEAELGVHVEMHGARAVVRGHVNDEHARSAILIVVAEELAGLDWYADLVVSRPTPPDYAEELA